MQKIIVPLLSFLLGITLTLVITLALIVYGSRLAERNSPRRTVDPATVASSTPGAPGMPPGVSGAPSGVPVTPPVQYARAWELLNAGRAQEAQDAFLEILSASPEDQHAMQGLVAARRALSGDNLWELRRQATVYRDAIRRGADIGDHYTQSAMAALVAASEEAAKEIEARGDTTLIVLSEAPANPPHRGRPVDPREKVASSAKHPPSATPVAKPNSPQKPRLPTAPTKKPGEAPSVSALQAAPAAAAQTPPAAPAAAAQTPSAAPAAATQTPPAAPAAAAQTPPALPVPAPQTPSALPNGNRLYMIRVGPISARDRASAIAKELLVRGFSPAKVTIQTASLFRVVSEPLPRSIAESLAATLAERGLHTQVEPLAGDASHLVFGIFTSQQEAETLSQRISAQGYDAWVVREGVAYTLELGPYPQSSIETVTGIIKAGTPEAAVITDAVPSPSFVQAPRILPSLPAPAPETPPSPPTSVPQTPSAAPVQAPQPPAPPSPSADSRLYVVRVGPVSNRDRATSITRELLIKGFSTAKAKVTQVGPIFRVVSEPLPRSVAESLAATLAGRGLHSHVEPLAGDVSHLVFGVFPTQQEAETLSQHIGAQGYDVWVVREEVAYTLELGPYPQSSIETVAGIIEANAPGAMFTVDPIP